MVKYFELKMFYVDEWKFDLQIKQVIDGWNK